MSYTKTTDFAVKDVLLTGNPAKIIKGSEINTEFDAIATADALNVKGPVSTVTDNTIARWDTTTGRAIQGTGVTISDTNDMSGVSTLSATTLAVSGTSTLTGNVSAPATVTAGTLSVTGNETVNGNLAVTGSSTVGSETVLGNLRVNGTLITTGMNTGTNESLVALSNSMHYGAIVKSIIYDTSKDSDGGAWRKRCTDKSWYTESLGFTGTWGGQAANVAAGWAACGSVVGGAYQNTTDGKFYTPTSVSTQTEIFRGNAREFPEQVAIVAESARVVIYDLTQVGTPMWMVFTGGAGQPIRTAQIGIAAANGQLNLSTTNGVIDVSFIKDGPIFRYLTGGKYSCGYSIAQRNTAVGTETIIASAAIVSNTANDVALTVLDTAPIDPATGLPVPTIAVFTAGGTSVIRDDGVVVNSTLTGSTYGASIFNGYLFTNRIDTVGYNTRFVNLKGIGASWAWTLVSTPYTTLGTSAPLGGTQTSQNYSSSGTGGGVVLLKNNPSTPASGMVSYITQAYNTGWLPGDIRGAYLADVLQEIITDGTSGTELISNGTFTTDTTGWTTGLAGTFVQSAGAAVLTNGGALSGYAYQIINTTIGKNYTVTATFTKGTAASGYLMAGTAAAGNTLGQVISAVSGTLTFSFTAQATTTYITVLNGDATVTNNSTWDNISVKQNGDLVTNGTFTTDTSGWTAQNGATLSATGAELTVTNAGATYGAAYQTVVTVVGKTYTVSCTARCGTASPVTLGVGTGAGGTTLGFANTTSGTNVQLNVTFVATGTATYISLINDLDSGGTGIFDNISVKLADPDRSVKNTGLVLNGTLTKTAVASGAGLVAYSGFSNSNYLEQPYNANLDFGTGDFCVMGWCNAAAGTILHRAQAASIGGILVAASGINLDLYGSASTTYTLMLSVASCLPTSGWYLLEIDRSAGVLYVRVNGVQVGTVANTTNLTYSGAIARIGNRLDNTVPLTVGALALWRISATAPSADQIAHIYRTELPLFQASAQCTIAGTSNAVTALAYDDVADTLHVGTSWGRSSFRDLLRVDSEATTVGAVTSVSANEGAVITGGATTGKFAQPAMVFRDELRRKDISRKALGKIPVPFDYTATASQTAFVLPKGYTTKTFQKNGTFVREGTGSPNFVRSDDGFQETCTLSAGATVGDWIQIMAVRK